MPEKYFPGQDLQDAEKIIVEDVELVPLDDAKDPEKEDVLAPEASEEFTAELGRQNKQLLQRFASSPGVNYAAKAEKERLIVERLQREELSEWDQDQTDPAIQAPNNLKK